jgi:hypothetical protein
MENRVKEVIVYEIKSTLIPNADNIITSLDYNLI